MKKECTCKKMIKDDKVTLIHECDRCYKKKIKCLRLGIKLAKQIVKISLSKTEYKGTPPTPNYSKGYINNDDFKIAEYSLFDKVNKVVKNEKLFIQSEIGEVTEIKLSHSDGNNIIFKPQNQQCNHVFKAVRSDEFKHVLIPECLKCKYRP